MFASNGSLTPPEAAGRPGKAASYSRLLPRLIYEWLCIIYTHHNHHHHHHQSVLPSASISLQTHEPKLQFCPKANSGTKVAILPGISRCGSFQLFSAPHSLFSIWTDLKRYESIPGAPTWRWGEWIWLTGPSRLHWNSPRGINISSICVFDQIRDPEIPITLRHLFYRRAKSDWDFRISDLVKNPDGTDI